MAKYVLFSHQQEPRPEDLDRIANAPGVKVLDRSAKRAMLLEGSETAVAKLNDELPDWTVSPEATYERPEPARQRIE
jgi:hypothetical protein